MQPFQNKSSWSHELIPKRSKNTPIKFQVVWESSGSSWIQLLKLHHQVFFYVGVAKYFIPL